MALSRIQTAEIADNAVTTSKVDDATVIATDIIDGTIVDSMVASGAAIAHTKCDLGTVAGLDVGTGANQIVQMDSTPKLPALNGSALTNLTAANLTGSFPTSPALSGAALTGIVTDFTPLENQMTRLALHIGAVEQLAKYNMIDQVIDDYEDATGIDASASINETLAGSAGAKYYSGSSNSNQTLISTTTTALTAPTKASIVLQTEDELGTATINTDVKAGVSRDALNYVDTTLAKIGTWGSGNVYAANDVTMPGTVMTKIITVAASKLVTDGTSQATLTLTEGYTYKFDTSDSTLSGHTFKFATAADAAGSTQYTTGVTESGTPGSANAYTQIVVVASAPTLYYYCSNHASMGGQANTPAEAATTSMRYRVDTKNQSYTASIGTAYTVSAVSNATTSTTQKKFGTHSLSFPALGDYFSIEDNVTWDYGTGDFTWEMWIYLAAISSQKKLFGSNQWGTQTYDWIFDVNPNRTLRLQLHGPPSPELSTSSTVPVSTWCHVACSRSSGTVKIFIDGTQGASTTMAQNLANVGTPFLGWKPANTGDGFIGYMDEVRLSNTARYTSNFTPATSAFTTDANTQLLLHGDGNLTDSSYTAESGKITRIHGTSLAWK